jgi:hypothetical protein
MQETGVKAAPGTHLSVARSTNLGMDFFLLEI